MIDIIGRLRNLITSIGYEGATALANKLTAARAALLDQITAARMSELDAANMPADIDGLTTRSGRVVLPKDQWCATPIASLAFSNVAADRDFANVILPAAGTFLPAGAVIQAVYLVVKWRKQVDSSGAANAINAANKTIRIKKAADGWGASLVAVTMANGGWHTAGNAPEGGDMIISDTDIKGKVDAFGTTYNIRSDQTTSGDAITVTAASLTLYDIYTGLRIYYTLG